jgi:hypothetical protein
MWIGSVLFSGLDGNETFFLLVGFILDKSYLEVAFDTCQLA